ncbi:hypothetical protein ISS86_01580 [Candidatus Microgenomates bacterium]|nr:hypothetical protein [Candidatus Microgenomates bacterium]
MKNFRIIIKQIFLRLLEFALFFIIPLILLITSVFIVRKVGQIREKISDEKIETETKKELIPSQILNNKSKYSQESITVRGKISPEAVVCERKECPAEDTCCGCPSVKNVVISDAGVVFTPKTKSRLKLLDTKGRPFCQREKSSCDYDCGDWISGAVYDVDGVFYAEPPPLGWRLSLDFYFQVKDKELIKKTGFKDLIGNVLEEIVGLVGKIKAPTYILR